MQHRPETQMVVLTVQSLAPVQQMPTPASCEAVASGGGEASAAQHGVIATSVVGASDAPPASAAGCASVLASDAEVVVPQAAVTTTRPTARTRMRLSIAHRPKCHID